MNINEFREVSEFETEYMQTVKNTEDNKRVLNKYVVNNCVDKQNRLRLNYLVKSLRDRSYITTMTAEKMFLIQSEVCKIDNSRHIKITDFDKFKSLYLNDEFDEEEDNNDEPEL